jgi:hypothetical protein
MTSQLILGNAQGVAIASDSAVTLGGGRRTLDTAEKIFPLPRPHRIAVLHSGSVTVHGLPYLLLLNEWLTTLDDAPLATVEAYRDHFLQWFGDNLQWLAPERMTREWIWLLGDRFEVIRDSVLEAVREDALGLGPERAALADVRAWAEGLPTFVTFENTDDEWLSGVHESLAEQVDEIFEYWFDDIPRSDEIDGHLRAYATEFYRRSGPWDRTATLAFVGFGESQVLPAYSVSQIGGVLGGRVLYRHGSSFACSSDGDPIFTIQPLGQTAAIDLFLRGVEGRTVDIATDAAQSELKVLRQEIEQMVDDSATRTMEFDRAFTETEQRMARSINDRVWDNSENRFVAPLRYAIAGLPTATLADVARSLVELQALRQTTTAEQSTVGGPIDVAVISRSGGFEWIKHKSVT